jgi:hypothetical protein
VVDGHGGHADLQRLYAAGLSSATILRLLPCLESPSETTSDAAFARLIEERDKLVEHIGGLTRTLASLNDLIEMNRAARPDRSAEQTAPDQA